MRRGVYMIHYLRTSQESNMWERCFRTTKHRSVVTLWRRVFASSLKIAASPMDSTRSANWQTLCHLFLLMWCFTTRPSQSRSARIPPMLRRNWTSSFKVKPFRSLTRCINLSTSKLATRTAASRLPVAFLSNNGSTKRKKASQTSLKKALLSEILQAIDKKVKKLISTRSLHDDLKKDVVILRPNYARISVVFKAFQWGGRR